MPWEHYKKPRGPQRGSGYVINAYVYIEEELNVNKSFGNSDKYPVHLYRILNFSRKQNCQFFEYKIMEVRTGQALEKWYREAELSLLGQEVQRIDWHGGGDDKTLRGGDD
ncbi:MAG: hypothetical protein ASARMPREDX12_003579 [Alectoria sarmentosa]|nr:MAG: hypothetical protein ASARMPREDX12_003579 [Alectoria sarmentosa]